MDKKVKIFKHVKFLYTRNSALLCKEIGNAQEDDRCCAR